MEINWKICLLYNKRASPKNWWEWKSIKIYQILDNRYENIWLVKPKTRLIAKKQRKKIEYRTNPSEVHFYQWCRQPFYDFRLRNFQQIYPFSTTLFESLFNVLCVKVKSAWPNTLYPLFLFSAYFFLILFYYILNNGDRVI